MASESKSTESKDVSDYFTMKCAILAELWNDYRDEEEWVQFGDENDVGLPLAHMLVSGLVKDEGLTAQGRAFINETWEVLCYTLDADSEVEYDNIEDLFDRSRLNPLGASR